MKLYSQIICILLVSISLGLNAKTTVSELTCEYHDRPLGIDGKNPRLSWKMVSDEQNVLQTAYEIEVKDGSKLIWNSGKVNSAESVNVLYSGPEIGAMRRVSWRVRIWDNQGKVSPWSASSWWETGLCSPLQWKASWITMANETAKESPKPSHFLRKDFSLHGKIKSARVYVSALGLYELYLNGKKVGNDYFTPGWTSYKKRIQYQVYDVTDMLKPTSNAVGAILGDGWYRGFIGFSGQKEYYGSKLALIAQIRVVYADGTEQWILTDDSWKATTGPILSSDIYHGEHYDARLEMPSWNIAGFDASKWGKVAILDHSKEILIASQGVPVQTIDEVKPIKLITSPKGETIFDLGQNMVGRIRLKVKGNKGQEITLKYAEVLDKNGNFYTENLRSARSTDVYVLKGEGEEIYEPRFTFHGFRYVKIEGFSGTPSLDAITGLVNCSAMKPTGTFTCSDPLINQLQKNIQWGQKGNFLDVPTDCPQRDERLGWTGDAQVFAPTAAFNFDVAAFYTKWMKDFAADQRENGVIPHVIPDVLNGQGGSTAWADAALIVPWETYLVYNDKRILEVQYPTMKSWVEYMRKRAGEDYLWTGDSHFGDWLAFATTHSDYPGATTEKDLIATAYFAYSSNLLARIAAIIGKNDDASDYSKLSKQVKNAFIHEFVTPSGRLVSHTQTAYCLALAFDLLPENLRPAAADFLASDVKKFKHLTTGFVGTPLLCKTLSANGYADLAFMLLKRKEYPSWLYPVTQGATTIWERWDGQKPDGSFQDVGMNSFNHYAYGAIGEWLYTYVAGIQPDEQNPGYGHFFLAPHPGGELNKAEAVFQSVKGEIKSAWNIENGTMSYSVSVPVNTTATVVLPNAKLEQVQINNQTLTSKQQCKAEQNSSSVKLILGSGIYSFSYPLVLK